MIEGTPIPYDWKLLVAFYIIDKCFEAWLGKTSTVKSGSMLELLWKVIKFPFKSRNQPPGE